MAHKGKATSDVSYNPEDPPSAYSNATVHSRLSQYIEVAKEVHGPEFDPTTADLDGEVIMRAGGGKKHGRYWIGDGVINTATTPSLSQIRARTTSSSPDIRPRPSIAQQRVDELQAQLQEERRLREEMETRVASEQKRIEAERARMEARMEEMMLYVQSLGAAVGRPPPPTLFAAPPPPHATTPNQSAASNNMPRQLGDSPGSHLGPHQLGPSP